MMNHYECDVAIKALLAEKIILFPTDTVWSLACLPYAYEAAEQILELKREKKAENFEVLFDSLARLKEYCPALHPKIDTLLSYHERPLTITITNPVGLPEVVYNSKRQVNVRISRSNLSRQLIRAARTPLLTTTASIDEQHYPKNFGAIPSNFLQSADYIMKIRQRDVHEEDQLSVKITMDEKGELVFLRE